MNPTEYITISQGKDGPIFDLIIRPNYAYSQHLDKVKTYITTICAKLPLTINSENYQSILEDFEIRSLFMDMFDIEREYIDDSKKYLFLLSVSDTGYNFGQYRIVSHLIRMGVKRNNIRLFPLYIDKEKYRYDPLKLALVIQEFNPSYICEISYVVQAEALVEINKNIRTIYSGLIMVGGPLTSSHLLFCRKHLSADLIMVGHGEYLLEEYLYQSWKQQKVYPNINNRHMCYGIQCCQDMLPILYPYINQYMDCLFYDIPMLFNFYEITGTINLFTSEVCLGNCIFCYRKGHLQNNCMSIPLLKELLLRIVESLPVYVNVKNHFLRFYDDDFFADQSRDILFLDFLQHSIIPYIPIYEIQLSVRTLHMQLQNVAFVDAIKALQLNRITIGFDGYNNNDLKRLRKGYNFDIGYNAIKSLSKCNIPILLYAILTTGDTNEADLNTSLLNMLRLSLIDNVYIGPEISSRISVYSDNEKLYPSFQGNSFAYLEIESVIDTLHENVNPYQVVMHAYILPKNRLVRAFLEKVTEITSMQSAYILPLICKFYQILAAEYDWLIDLYGNEDKILYELINEKHKYAQLYSKLAKRPYDLLNREETKTYINECNAYQRILADLNDKISLAENKQLALERLRALERIIDEYSCFVQANHQPPSNEKVDSHSESIRRLLILPLLYFNHALKHKEKIKYSPQIERLFGIQLVMTTEELELFRS